MRRIGIERHAVAHLQHGDLLADAYLELSSHDNDTFLAGVVGVASIPAFTRVVRGSVLSTREAVYVDAARVVGCPDHTILRRHILPNIVAPVIVLGTLNLGTAIIVGASLSYLGVGVQPPTPEWGSMLSDGRQYLLDQWWIATFPGLAIPRRTRDQPARRRIARSAGPADYRLIAREAVQDDHVGPENTPKKLLPGLPCYEDSSHRCDTRVGTSQVGKIGDLLAVCYMAIPRARLPI